MQRLYLIFALWPSCAIGPLHAQEAALKPLLEKLDSPKSEIRFDALMELAALGPKAAPAVERVAGLLTTFDVQDHVAAVVALGKIGKAATPALKRLLVHEDELVRLDAVWALGLVGKDAKAEVPGLLKMANADPDNDVRVRTIEAAARIAAGDQVLLKELWALCQEKKTPAVVRLAVIEQLRHWGRPAIAPLGDSLRQDDAYHAAQQSLGHLLGKHKTKSSARAMLPYVLDAYRLAKSQTSAPSRSKPFPSRVFVSDLCDGEGMNFVLATVGEELLPGLEDRLLRKEAQERKEAAEILGRMGLTLQMHGDAPELVDRIARRLTPLLKDSDPEMRLSVATVMPRTKDTVAAVRDALLDDVVDVRWQATVWLGWDRHDAVAALQKRMLAATGEEQVRIACALASTVTDREALAFLWKHLSDPKAELRHHVAYSISRSNWQYYGQELQEPFKKTVVPVLVASLQSKDPVERREAAKGLAATPGLVDGRHVDALIAALKDSDARTRYFLAILLRTHSIEKRSDVLPALRPSLRAPDPLLRMVAADSFSNNVEGLPALLAALDQEKDRKVRNHIIGRLGYRSEPAAIEALVKLAGNEDDRKPVLAVLSWMEYVARERGKIFPRILDILKKDDVIRRTIGEMPAPPTDVAAAKAMARLLMDDKIAVNHGAAYTLNHLVSIMLADCGPWAVPIEKALELRMPKLQALMESKDLAVRREACELLGELRTMQKEIEVHMKSRRPADKELEAELRTRFDSNQQVIVRLLQSARRDADLSIRRIARKIEP